MDRNRPAESLVQMVHTIIAENTMATGPIVNLDSRDYRFWNRNVVSNRKYLAQISVEMLSTRLASNVHINYHQIH